MTVLQQSLIRAAINGDRVILNGKTIWSGLGNRAGLHSYAQTVVRKKWAKSGKTFTKKVMALKKGDMAEVHRFFNQTRDRGRWRRIMTGHVGGIIVHESF